MFVSSYNTYIGTVSAQNTKSQKVESNKESSSIFDLKFTTPTVKSVIPQSKLPIDYISNYKALNNRQLLEQKDNSENNSTKKLAKINSINSAKVAYTENTTMFSLLIKPKTTLDQTPKLEKRLPLEPMKMKESIAKHVMVNTYIANENYYKITA